MKKKCENCGLWADFDDGGETVIARLRSERDWLIRQLANERERRQRAEERAGRVHKVFMKGSRII